MKYSIGDKVKTGYGVGKIVDIKGLDYNGNITYCYKIKYSLFKKLWCFEFSIEGKVDKEVKQHGKESK